MIKNMTKELSNTKYRNLFILLKRRKITQKTLAEAIGVHHGNISNWKRGILNPSVQSLVKTADYFNVSVDFLLGRTGEENPADSLQNVTKKEIADTLSAVMTEAENFAVEAVERYGAKDKYNPMCTSLIAGITEIIENLKL